MTIRFEPEGYMASEYEEAFLTKDGRTRKVYVVLPYYTWKPNFEQYAQSRGFSVRWR